MRSGRAAFPTADNRARWCARAPRGPFSTSLKHPTWRCESFTAAVVLYYLYAARQSGVFHRGQPRLAVRLHAQGSLKHLMWWRKSFTTAAVLYYSCGLKLHVVRQSGVSHLR